MDGYVYEGVSWVSVSTSYGMFMCGPHSLVPPMMHKRIARSFAPRRSRYHSRAVGTFIQFVGIGDGGATYVCASTAQTNNAFQWFSLKTKATAASEAATGVSLHAVRALIFATHNSQPAIRTPTTVMSPGTTTAAATPRTATVRRVGRCHN